MIFRPRIVACLTVLLLLAPTVRWFQDDLPGQACACVPSACMCEGHEHASGHSPMCSMANGGRCGVRSADLELTTLGAQPLPAPAEMAVRYALPFSAADSPALRAAPLRGHSRPLELPPR